MKICSRCKQEKDESCFYVFRAKGRKTCLTSCCKSCNAERRKQQRHHNRLNGQCAHCNKEAAGYLCTSCRVTAKRALSKYSRTEKGKRNYDKHRFGSGRFRYMRAYSAQRGLSWSLTREQYDQLVAQPCWYCEMENSSKAGIGLDRLDNAKGYEPGNVVSCCSECNIARSDNFTPEEMKVIGMAIRKVKMARVTQPINQRYIAIATAKGA